MGREVRDPGGAKRERIRRPVFAVALHDGFYGTGTGAGHSNRAFVRTLAGLLDHRVRLVILPIRLSPGDYGYDRQWHQDMRGLIDRRGGEVRPLDNGTKGSNWGGLTAFRILSNHLLSVLAEDVVPGAEHVAVVAFDVPFMGFATQLPPGLLSSVALVPRASRRLHDPGDHELIHWEEHGMHAVAAGGGRIAATSAYMRRHLCAEYGVPPEALVDLTNGLVSTDLLFGPEVPELDPVCARSGFLFAMGRAVAHKGFEDLLDALAILRAEAVRLPPLVLAPVRFNSMASAHTYQQRLRAQGSALGLQVQWMERFSHRVRNILAHPGVRAVIVPSRVEPFGRVPLEAFAAGAAPVVATRAGGLAEQVVEGVTGYTANPADPESLAGAVRRALSVTDEQRGRLRARGRELLTSRFDYERAIRNFVRQIAPWALCR